MRILPSRLTNTHLSSRFSPNSYPISLISCLVSLSKYKQIKHIFWWSVSVTDTILYRNKSVSKMNFHRWSFLSENQHILSYFSACCYIVLCRNHSHLVPLTKYQACFHACSKVMFFVNLPIAKRKIICISFMNFEGASDSFMTPIPQLWGYKSDLQHPSIIAPQWLSCNLWAVIKGGISRCRTHSEHPK